MILQLSNRPVSNRPMSNPGHRTPNRRPDDPATRGAP